MTVKEAVDILELWCCPYPNSKLGSEYGSNGRLLTPMIELTSNETATFVTPLMEEVVDSVCGRFKDNPRYIECFDYDIKIGESSYPVSFHVILNTSEFLKLYRSYAEEFINSAKAIDGSKVLEQQDFVDLLNGDIKGLKIENQSILGVVDSGMNVMFNVWYEESKYLCILDISFDKELNKLKYELVDWSEV